MGKVHGECENCQGLTNENKALTAQIEAKDELIFAYDATRSPVIDRTIIDLRAEVERRTEEANKAKGGFDQAKGGK